MSVVLDRPIFARFLTAGGECSVLILLWYLARVLFDLYSWTVFIGFLYVLACRPTDSFIVRFFGLVLRGTPILAGGIGVARVVVGAVFGVCLWFRAIVSQ